MFLVTCSRQGKGVCINQQKKFCYNIIILVSGSAFGFHINVCVTMKKDILLTAIIVTEESHMLSPCYTIPHCSVKDNNCTLYIITPDGPEYFIVTDLQISPSSLLYTCRQWITSVPLLIIPYHVLSHPLSTHSCNN